MVHVICPKIAAFAERMREQYQWLRFYAAGQA
jgi:hypothetical protein